MLHVIVMFIAFFIIELIVIGNLMIITIDRQYAPVICLLKSKQTKK